MTVDVLIVGGGLAGLSLADRLFRAGVTFRLIEARPRFGGRIAAARDGAAVYDLGPSWFWPGQPLMADLTRRLILAVLEQYSSGATMLEDQAGRIRRGEGFASMAGSWRVEGGMQAIIDALAAGLPPGWSRTGIRATGVTHTGQVSTSDGDVVAARVIVLAVPPRVAATLAFDPPLDAATLRRLTSVPTWMAGQAKFVATYERPFWRAAGLSGDAVSQRGPLVEIHDATPVHGGPAALFGFVGVPADVRRAHARTIRADAVAQLGRLFGPDALSPRRVFLQDWAWEVETATVQDHAPPLGHPAYGPIPDPTAPWADRIHLGSSEVAGQGGGFLEGALSRAQTLAARLCRGCEGPEG